MEKALRNGGCGHCFDFNTLEPKENGKPGAPANDRQVKFGARKPQTQVYRAAMARARAAGGGGLGEKALGKRPMYGRRVGARNSLFGAEFRVGARVEGNWYGRGRWYKGTIKKVYHRDVPYPRFLYDIDYDDGDKETCVPAKRVKPLNEAGGGRGANAGLWVGARVEGNWKGNGRWYKGTIMKKVNHGAAGFLYNIDYDDGDKEWNVTANRVRLSVHMV